MPSVLNCPTCERRLRVPDPLIRERVKCPTCGETFTADPDAPPQEPLEEDLPPPARPELVPPRRRDVPGGVRPPRKPGQVQALGVMMLVGGILGVLVFAGLGLGSAGACCLWPGTCYSLVMGTLAVIKGAELLGDNAHLARPPRGIAVMMIINILNLDVANLAMGIVCLVFLNEPEVRRYFRGPVVR